MPRRFALAALAALALLVAAPGALAQDARARCVDGFALVPDVGAFPCDRVDLVGYLAVSEFASPGSNPATANNDIWGWTDPETGVEYALVGTYNGTGFVDLSVPSAPRLVAKMPTTGSLAPVWRDIKVYRDHAFVVADAADDHGVQIFDLTRLRALTGGPVTVQPDVIYRQVESAHNLVMDEESGFAYAVGVSYRAGQRAALGLPPECDVPGFHAIDVRDPKAPVFAGCFSDVGLEAGTRTPGYTHDAQCVVYRGPDADYVGRQICLGANEDIVTVFDVTDKADVRIVSQAAYPNDVYTHQGWLTDDHRYFLVDDEIDEIVLGLTQRTIMFDLEDLDDPELAFEYDSGLTVSDHNQYVRGRYAFQSNYEAGLRIVDLEGIGSGAAVEVAFFDTYPDADARGYSGQWSNYPYFESGLVIANDGEYGLFVLRPDAALAVARADGPRPPAGYALSEPRPNPTTSGARLSLEVDAAQSVRADLYDVAGRRVAAVFEGPARPGVPVELRVEAGDLPAGVYVLRVTGETFEAARRLVLTR